MFELIKIGYRYRNYELYENNYEVSDDAGIFDHPGIL